MSGQAHLQHYTEPSAEPLLATSSTLQGTILPLGPGTFTHNTAGVPIIVACTKADLIDDNTDLVGAGASGMGGMVKGKGGEWEERTDGIMQILRTICLKCAYHFKFFLHSFLILMAWQTAQASFTPRRSQRHSTYCVNTCCTPYLYPRLLPLTARSTALRHQCETHSRSCTSRIHSTATASLYLRDGTVGERSWFYATVSTRKRGARHGSAIYRPTPESTRIATTALEKCTRPSWRTKVPRYVLTCFPTFSSSRLSKHAADAAPSPQQPNPRTSLPLEELRRERTTRRSRPARHIPHSHGRIRRACRGPRRALELFILLASDSRARASGDGG
jgi:hypothetical protein